MLLSLDIPRAPAKELIQKTELLIGSDFYTNMTDLHSDLLLGSNLWQSYTDNMSTTNYSSTPNDSRYIPLTQQPYLCVPACIQIVMYKHNIPLVPQEEIGYHLGLTVPPDAAKSFFKVRVADQPPVNSGYGTQIQTLEYEPNQAFNKLKVLIFLFVNSFSI